MKKELSDFRDIHTHNLNAGDDAIINLPWGAEVPDSGYYSVGIHPWDTADATEADIERLRRLAAHPRVVAVGEAGMDALRGGPLADQEALLRRHIAVSEAVGKPLILHAVRTLSDILRLRRELRPTQRWVIHGFRGKPATALQLIAAGIDISIGARHNPDVPAVVPAAHLHHETD